ncbi:universal stress protein [Marinospirillum alkaliphilum]|jgi:nucleotide-binding universal stress UspA family protein|uniref:Nucleotide-binding universal stress protein, UspA family n=1 Tax=Marinospirillum alkaliphilum DSM 21637 TaxID=1122209 RepID=A0A1K1UYG9_9GAMM|nr:universal stress protein [Marinospirillum alkaliphilum]SFX17961.1 Nucleotide-binding universal stress protein, UspA family [Marinospirillum alkaliphilum DSM 21637]
MKNIVACIDNSHVAAAVCDASAWISKQVERPLLLLHVLDKSVYPAKTDLSGNLGLGARTHLLEELADLDAQRSKLALEQGRLQLEEARKRVEQQGVREVETLQRHGHFVETLADLQQDTRILVMGRQGEDHQAGVREIGSNLETVIRTLGCRILVTPPDFKTPSKVLLAYDASPTAKKVLQVIASSPLCKGLPFHLLMVGERSDKNLLLLEEAREELEARGHSGVTTALKSGEVEQTLLNHVAEHQLDLIVMGAYGHSRIRQFLVGSTTTNLLRRSEVPILLMRQ